MAKGQGMKKQAGKGVLKGHGKQAGKGLKPGLNMADTGGVVGSSKGTVGFGRMAPYQTPGMGAANASKRKK